MANRSDRHLSNLSNSQGTKARSPDQEKVRGFPSWPGVQRSAPAKGRIHDRNRIKAIRSSHLAHSHHPESSHSVRSASESRVSRFSNEIDQIAAFTDVRAGGVVASTPLHVQATNCALIRVKVYGLALVFAVGKRLYDIAM